MKAKSCHCCGLIQTLPLPKKGYKVVCTRCHTPLSLCSAQQNTLSGVFALTAIIVYFPAISLPLLQIEKLGHLKEDSLLSSVSTLMAEGYWVIGLIILIFSIVLPLVKLLSIAALNLGIIWQDTTKALVYRWIEWVGRWGMLDILLVAILVAFVKLGDLISIDAGPGLLAFSLMVFLSLIASALFNPHCLWEEEA